MLNESYVNLNDPSPGVRLEGLVMKSCEDPLTIICIASAMMEWTNCGTLIVMDVSGT